MIPHSRFPYLPSSVYPLSRCRQPARHPIKTARLVLQATRNLQRRNIPLATPSLGISLPCCSGSFAARLIASPARYSFDMLPETTSLVRGLRSFGLCWGSAAACPTTASSMYVLLYLGNTECICMQRQAAWKPPAPATRPAQ